MNDPNLIFPSLISQEDLDESEHEHWAGLWNERVALSLEEDFTRKQLIWASTPASVRTRSLEGIDYLYKYKSFDEQHPDRTKAILSEGKLWVPSLHSLNDPLEGGFLRPKDALDAKAALAFAYLMRSPWSGCISFSLHPVSKLMWSHYSDDHRGFCIEYRRQDSFLLASEECRPVLYRSSLPEVELGDPRKTSPLADLLFWTKSEVWEYEHEWRLRYPRIDSYTRAGLLKPHAVIFGVNCPRKVKKFIRDCVPDLRYGEIRASSRGYELTIDWEGPQVETHTVDSAAIQLSRLFATTVDLAIDIAKTQLDEYGEFNPFGVIVYGGEANILMLEEADLGMEGIRGNQLTRRVEDLIRKAGTKKQLEFAGTISDANVWPADGGPMRSAIRVSLEQKGGPAVMLFQDYEIREGIANLGEKTIKPGEHHFIPE